ncbi:hypothetical protein INR49_015278, partial [Caranx melampygus]
VLFNTVVQNCPDAKGLILLNQRLDGIVVFPGHKLARQFNYHDELLHGPGEPCPRCCVVSARWGVKVTSRWGGGASSVTSCCLLASHQYEIAAVGIPKPGTTMLPLSPAGGSKELTGTESATQTTTMSDGRIYVGNLPMDVQERDIEDLFYKYGKIREIELKNNRGTIPFAFVRFEDPRDADDAVYGRNGYGYGDSKLRVEYPRSSGAKFGPMGGGGGGGPRGRFGPPTRRSEFRVIVTGRWTS